MVYDLVRLEEKAIIAAAKKRSERVDLKIFDSKDLYFDLFEQSKIPDIFGNVVLQRCASYFRNLHLTAVLEGKGTRVVNDLNSALITGNKLFMSMALVKEGVPTPRTKIAFTQDAALKA